MNGNPLTKCFVNRPSECPVQVRFSAEHQREAVYRVVAVIHQHFDIIQDTRGEVLGFIYSQKQGLTLFVVKIPDLFLYGFEHPGFSAFIAYTQDVTKLLIELRHTDCGKTDVFHMVEIGIQPLREAPEGVGFPHAGAGGKEADAPGVLQVIQTGSHLPEVL